MLKLLCIKGPHGPVDQHVCILLGKQFIVDQVSVWSTYTFSLLNTSLPDLA